MKIIAVYFDKSLKGIWLFNLKRYAIISLGRTSAPTTSNIWVRVYKIGIRINFKNTELNKSFLEFITV